MTKMHLELGVLEHSKRPDLEMGFGLSVSVDPEPVSFEQMDLDESGSSEEESQWPGVLRTGALGYKNYPHGRKEYKRVEVFAEPKPAPKPKPGKDSEPEERSESQNRRRVEKSGKEIRQSENEDPPAAKRKRKPSLMSRRKQELQDPIPASRPPKKKSNPHSSKHQRTGPHDAFESKKHEKRDHKSSRSKRREQDERSPKANIPHNNNKSRDSPSPSPSPSPPRAKRRSPPSRASPATDAKIVKKKGKKRIYPGRRKSRTAKRPAVRGSFRCTKCGLHFVEKWRVTRHMKEVHQPKRWGCTLCKKRYTQKGTVTRHQKLHHKGRGSVKVVAEKEDFTTL